MDALRDDVIDAAETVHAELGAGHTEAVYHRAMEHELSTRGIAFASEGTITIFYDGVPVGRKRPDLFVRDGDTELVVELKAGGSSGEAQLRSYVTTLDDDDNYSIDGGLLIRFDETVETSTETDK